MGEEAHTLTGSQFGSEGVEAYARTRHGPDGARFLDPFFRPYLDNLQGKRVIDIGAGAGPWTVYAAEHGASEVVALDYQIGMVKQARKAATDARVDEMVSLYQGDVAALPHPDSQYNLALSINVGCNLPNTSTVAENAKTRVVGFGPHFTEMARVLQSGGQAIVTAPTSFGIVFTSGERPQAQVLQSISTALDSIGTIRDAEVIKQQLNGLTDVYRATFAFRNGRLVLNSDESQLVSGEPIWRKLPGLTVPNRYHSEAEYEAAFAAAGLKVVSAHCESFATKKERLAYNQSQSSEEQLGPEYVTNPPFAVWVLKKV